QEVDEVRGVALGGETGDPVAIRTDDEPTPTATQLDRGRCDRVPANDSTNRSVREQPSREHVDVALRRSDHQMPDLFEERQDHERLPSDRRVLGEEGDLNPFISLDERRSSLRDSPLHTAADARPGWHEATPPVGR